MAGKLRGMFGRVRETLFPSRQAPVQSTTQAGQVRERKYGGSTKAMAAAYGVAPRTVLRWIDGTRHPTKPEHEQQLRREALDVQTTERGRERKARQLSMSARTLDAPFGVITRGSARQAVRRSAGRGFPGDGEVDDRRSGSA
ncbi:hypothetical protein GCM10010495_80180 [Kitasatospora herbaricolor]|uniref:hypothetical protein n=1 Tax=Kitasatospora herbaricolor TaxID=68217 RepID=UPI00174C6E6B|nr:hypothetical protein [Kitasatospora herbaricolor]MDQ0305565.1 hypothetical protein [Kitasatospora herbaricolor]GGV50453.1 hypothetical protein GCM10010495_80180 [Kitasatospora herbaricolor]